MRRLACVLVVAAGLINSARAETAPDELYAAGRYEDAITAGTAQHTAEGLTIAAHAAFADAVLKDKPCLECLKRAEDLARRAIAADPNAPTPHVYLAGILGYEGRIVGTLSAKLKGYPEEAKRQLDTALAKDPTDARALAALGGWNIAIVSAGGATLARWIYGASAEQGLADFDKAFRRDPDDVNMRFQYALGLSAYDRDTYHKDIVSSLENAQRNEAPTAFDKVAKARALMLLNLLKAGKFSEYDAAVRKFQGYP